MPQASSSRFREAVAITPTQGLLLACSHNLWMWGTATLASSTHLQAIWLLLSERTSSGKSRMPSSSFSNSSHPMLHNFMSA